MKNLLSTFEWARLFLLLFIACSRSSDFHKRDKSTKANSVCILSQHLNLMFDFLFFFLFLQKKQKNAHVLRPVAQPSRFAKQELKKLSTKKIQLVMLLVALNTLIDPDFSSPFFIKQQRQVIPKVFFLIICKAYLAKSNASQIHMRGT